MNSWKYGYNYDTGSVPFEKFITDAINSGSNIHLIMSAPQNGIPGTGDLGLLWRIYNRLVLHYPDLMLIWRIYSGREGNWNTFPDSKIYQAVFDGMTLPPNTIIDSFANEPSLNGDSYMTNEKYVRHELQMLRDLKAVGVAYAIGAFSTGTPHEKMIQMGVYDKLIQEAEYWSMHLYGMFPLEAGETIGYDILNKTEENRQWIRNTYFNGEEFPEDYKGWLLGRPKHIEERAKVIGATMPKIIITEGFVDLIDNAPAQIRSEWSNNFGVDVYLNDPRGVLSWFNYFNWLFPELTIEETLVMIMNHIRDNILYQDYIVGMTLFGYNRQWGYPNGKHRFSGHNWEDEALDLFRRDYLKIVNANENGDVVIPDNPDENPTSEMGELWSTRVGGSNIRQDPIISNDTLVYINGNQLILSDPIDVVMLNQSFTTPNNNYTWFQFLHQNGQVYYVAQTGNISYLKNEEQTDQPKYIVDLLGATQVMTQDEIKELIDFFEEIIDFIYEVNQEGDIDEDEYTKRLFLSVMELITETNDLQVQKTLDFMNLVLVGLKEADKF